MLKSTALFLFTTLCLTVFSQQAFPSAFEKAFTDTSATGNYCLLDLGKIKLPSGKVIAVDPVTISQSRPFLQKFPVGEFPVQLAMVQYEKCAVAAFSRIVFSDKEVKEWRFALLPGQKDIALTDTTFYCFSVDAGMAMFIDQAANKVLLGKIAGMWNEVFIDKPEKFAHTGFIHSFDNYNFAVFSTGYGDGCYATYIGYDSEGNPCRLLVDFMLVEWWK